MRLESAKIATASHEARPAFAPELGRKVIVGLLGAGIGRSRTPHMHEREGARLGLRYSYQLLDTSEKALGEIALADILAAARAMGFAGLNVTYPYKQEVIAHLDTLSDNAARIGAVNTIVFSSEGTRGHNTDLWGYAEGFRRTMSGAALNQVALIGAGGAGAAVSRALLQLGVKSLFVVDVDAARSGALAARLAADFPDRAISALSQDELADLPLSGIVNATPIGMDKNAGLPVAEAIVKPGIWVSDIIYYPLETELLRLASTRGCRVLSGAHMALYQAVRAFELFTGIKPDELRMRETFDAF